MRRKKGQPMDLSTECQLFFSLCTVTTIDVPMACLLGCPKDRVDLIELHAECAGDGTIGKCPLAYSTPLHFSFWLRGGTVEGRCGRGVETGRGNSPCFARRAGACLVHATNGIPLPHRFSGLPSPLPLRENALPAASRQRAMGLGFSSPTNPKACKSAPIPQQAEEKQDNKRKLACSEDCSPRKVCDITIRPRGRVQYLILVCTVHSVHRRARCLDLACQSSCIT